MAPLYMLDTKTVSYIIKGNHPAVDRRLMAVDIENVSISTVTQGELCYGLARLPGAVRLKIAIESFLLRVTILRWDSDAARQYGAVRASLERGGQPMSVLDTMIAAHALAADAVLVTHDRAFHRIKDLKLQDWTR